MKGFDPRWKDVPDYILGITFEIWEQRQLHTLHDYYTPDVIVRSPASVVVGNQTVIDATEATLAEFPDRQLLGEDVIWSGDAEAGDLYSSHRIFSTATHGSDGVYGAASGTRLGYRVIADCAVRDNAVYDEWLIRDQSAIVRQLGLSPRDYARDLIAREGGPENCVAPFTPSIDRQGNYRGRGNDHEAGARYADGLSRLMHGERDAVTDIYDRACQLDLPGGAVGHGYADAETFWNGLRAAFPDATFDIHHVIGRDDAGMSPRAAVRWSLHGRHAGDGVFGKPTGAHVYVMGISHAEYGPWGLRREYVLIDETAIWKQILMQTG